MMKIIPRGIGARCTKTDEEQLTDSINLSYKLI